MKVWQSFYIKIRLSLKPHQTASDVENPGDDDAGVAKARGARTSSRPPGRLARTAPWALPSFLTRGDWVGPERLHLSRFPGETGAAGPGTPGDNHWPRKL